MHCIKICFATYFTAIQLPCFSGGWSQRCITVARGLCGQPVLILVLVEDGLGDKRGVYVRVLLLLS